MLVSIVFMAQIVISDKAFEALIDGAAKIEKLAGGMQFTEGPVWSRITCCLQTSPRTPS